MKSILLPTDFSNPAAQAAAYAYAFVDKFGAELHVLHVIERLASSLPEVVLDLSESLEKYFEKAEVRALENLSNSVDPMWEKGKRVTLATREGAPFVQIVQYAREHGIDLIVMGTHGRSGLPHAIMGSVAERVVRKAPCPVLTVRPADHEFEMP